MVGSGLRDLALRLFRGVSIDFRLAGAQPAVAGTVVGSAQAMEIVLAVDGSRQRPLIGTAPLVGTHHEDTHLGIFVDAVGNPLQPKVEPPQLELVDRILRLWPEVDLADSL